MFKILAKLIATALSLFGLTVAIYWFNLDMKLMWFLQPYLDKWYDGLDRDRRL